MKRIIQVLLAILLSLCSMTSCKGAIDSMVIVNQETNIMNLVTYVGNHNQFLTLLSTNPGVNELKNSVGISYLKRVEYGYSTLIQSDQHFVMLYFDDDKELNNYQLVSMLPLSKKDSFAQLQVGMSVDKVREIDSQNDYSFLYHSWSAFPKISYHYFSDGTGLVITYSDEMSIISITHFMA